MRHRRCYYDQEVLITDRKLIAIHYLKCVLRVPWSAFDVTPLCRSYSGWVAIP